MSLVLAGKSGEVIKRPPSSHPVEGIVTEIPDKIKKSWKMVDAALIEFTSAAEEYKDAWLGYIAQPSTEKWSVVVSKWDGVLKSMSGFRNMLEVWKTEWFSTFHQAIPLDEVDVLIRAAKRIMPPVDPVPVTEGIAIAFNIVDKAKRKVLGLLKEWVDAWTSYIKHPTKATWSDVTDGWHKFQEAIPGHVKDGVGWRKKISVPTPFGKADVEARKVRRVVTGEGRKMWRENRWDARAAWRGNRWDARAAWRETGEKKGKSSVTGQKNKENKGR